MSTTVPDIQQSIQGIEQIGVAAASPFIKSPSGQATEQKVLAEVNLGVAALPLLASLFSAISGLFHHLHAQTSAPVAPVQLGTLNAKAPLEP